MLAKKNDATLIASKASDTVGKGKIALRKPEVKAKKNFHFSLLNEDVARLEYLQTRIGSGKQAEVFSAGLTLLESILKEYDEGATFYIKKPHSESVVYNIFDEQS